MIMQRSIRFFWRLLAVALFLQVQAAWAMPELGPYRYEAESMNLSNVTTASANTGYAGSGYVTGFTSEWSKISFDRSINNSTLARIDIRYANGTGSAVTNLALYVGSGKIQDISLPTTANWSTWGTVSVTFNLPAGYQGINIRSNINTSVSANIDYLDLSLDVSAATPPGSFSQTSPTAGATGVSTTPAFTWGAASGATSYALIVSTSSTYASPVINQTGLTGTSFTPSSALANNTLYYWKVSATNANGTTVSSNAGLSFTTQAAPVAPGAFTQATPTAGSTGVSTTPAFSWAASSGASSYTLLVSTSSTYASPIINQASITGTSFTPSSALAASTLYYWKVTAVNAVGSTVATNAGLSFTTSAPPPVPGNFSQSAPAAGVTGVALTPGFSWTASSNASSYTLVVSTSSTYASPIINQSGISGTSFTPGSNLSNSTLYYWKVTAINGSGSTEASNAGLSFTTLAASGGGGTAIRYEAEQCNLSNASVSTAASGYSGTGFVNGMTSEWSKVSFERSYNNPTLVRVDIRYSNASGSTINTMDLYNGSAKIQDVSFPATANASTWAIVSYTFNMPAGYQGIGLHSEANVSNSINLDYFDLTIGVPPAAPGSFTQSTPAAGATGVSTTPNFSWTAASNATSYTLVVSTNSSFTSPIINQSGITGTTYTSATALAANTVYYWKVSATNSGGNTDASNAGLSFTTAAPPPAPGAFSQSTPASGATDVNVLPTFTWGAASNASSYTLVVSTSSTYASPVINQSGISGTSYSAAAALTYTTLYYWKVTAVNVSGSTVATNAGLSFTTAAQPPVTQNGDGTLIRQYWAGIAGANVSALTSNANYPNNPTSTSTLTKFDAPRDVAEAYGARIKGYIKAPSTGTYTFKIASDDNSELWISTNESPANKVLVASVSGWTNQEQYNKYGTQSGNVSMVANNWYYVEALHKEDSGGDHLTVVWIPPAGSQVIVPSSVLSSALPTPIPVPGNFSQTAPASGATGVSVSPAFTWGASSSADSYTLVVSTSSTYANPLINQSGITGTIYTPGVALQGTTTYYWKVTAVNVTGTKVASNAGISFTTAAPPPPGSFTQSAPASGASNVSQYPNFTWATSANASGYNLVVSTSSTYASPVINLSNLTTTSYAPTTALAGNTTYYWKVTAVNGSGSTVASNAGISFTTAVAPVPGTTYYVATTGLDAPGRGSSTLPYRTIAYAAQQVPAGLNNTIYVNPGTYSETEAIKLPLGVNLQGAGEAQVTITSAAAIPAPGIDQGSGDWKLWYDGSLIQLASDAYSGANPKYGSLTQMLTPANGNQTLSGFTLDGNNKVIKAGVWVQCRSGVTMHHVTIKNFQQRGAVFGRSDMWWYEPMPAGKWMTNTTVFNCTFLNNGAQLGSETLGNLCLAGLDGADIYNITINDNVGYGIKFIFVGHFRNVKIHDCNINVNEADAAWGEKISIELWNLKDGNEVYNVVCNTWLSFVNHAQMTTYQPVGTAVSNLRVNNVRMIDSDGVSSKEAIEAALSGVEISDCYIQDKGFGIAIWYGGGSYELKNYLIRNNIFANVARTPNFGFGNSAALFCPDPSNNIKIYNNVFHRMGVGLSLTAATGVDIRNNVFLETEAEDVKDGASLTFTNNLKYHTNPTKANFSGNNISANSTNILGAPGFNNSGNRWDNYYKPASGSSFCVNKGVNVGLSFSGSAPDIGRWEYTGTPLVETELMAFNAKYQTKEADFSVFPVPSSGTLTVGIGKELEVKGLSLINSQGQVMRLEKANNLRFFELDLSQYPAGIYFLRLEHTNGVSVKRVILDK